MAYTYKDFEDAMATAGLSGRFSQYDLELARNNPSAGMGLLSSKNDYINAATDADRAAANARAEAIRTQYGSYTGGAYGKEYNPIATPSSFSPGSAPSYTSKYQDDIGGAYSALKDYGDYSYSAPKPAYDNRYGATVDALLGGITSRAPFSYDYKSDPSYSAYKKEYTREGQRATSDALGSAAAATGGRPSSYAVTAASQAGDYYASKLSDKIPELYDAAYNRYTQEFQNKLSTLSAAQGVEQSDYAKYLDSLSQYNTDRNFDYGTYYDKYNRLSTQFDAARGLENDAYARYQTDLNQYNADRDYDYGQYYDNLTYNRDAAQTAYNRSRDALSDEQSAYKNRLEQAELMAGYGDLSGLRELGLDTSAYESNTAAAKTEAAYQKQLDFALDAAKYGDYRYLRSMGIDTSAYEAQAAAEAAASAASAAGKNKSAQPSTAASSLTEGPQFEQYGDDVYVVKTNKGWFPLSTTDATAVAYAYQRYQSGRATDEDYTILERYFTENELGVKYGSVGANSLDNMIDRFERGDYSDEVINALLAYGYTKAQLDQAIKDAAKG